MCSQSNQNPPSLSLPYSLSLMYTVSRSRVCGQTQVFSRTGGYHSDAHSRCPAREEDDPSGAPLQDQRYPAQTGPDEGAVRGLNLRDGQISLLQDPPGERTLFGPGPG